jgi:hypothetical protein
VIRVALSGQQVGNYGLPPLPGKPADSRARAFTDRHGSLVQVELDAMDPTVLRDLYQDALDQFVDVSAFEAVLAEEEEERADLRVIADQER